MSKRACSLFFATLLAGFGIADSRPVLADANWARSGWSPVIIARGEYRAQLRSMPIEARPMRPFHFYGNMVRRIHHLNTKSCGPRGQRGHDLTVPGQIHWGR